MKKMRIIYNMVHHSFDLEYKVLGKWYLDQRFELKAAADNPEKVFVHYGIISAIAHAQNLGYKVEIG